MSVRIPADRMTPESWIEAGLAALRQDGPGALRADTLAKRLGVSRGSFYWHFENVDMFCKRVGTAWERAVVAAMADAGGEAGGEAGQALRLRLLLWARRLQGIDEALERQMRAWAAQSVLARVSVDRVDRRRLESLRALFEAAGWDGSRSLLRARALYAVLAARFTMGRRHGFGPAEIAEVIEALIVPGAG